MKHLERVLVRQVNWLGDLVMSLPATRAVRDAYPNARLTVLVKESLAGFYDGADWVDEVLPLSSRTGLAAQIRLARQLAGLDLDAAILFPRSFSSALAPWLARVPCRVGWADDARAWLLTKRLRRSPELLEMHQVNDHSELVRAGLGIEVNTDQPSLPVSARHRQAMRDWLRQRRRGSGRLIGLAVAAAFGPAKEWPADSYAALIDRLAAEHDTECVLVGAPGERERCLAIASSTTAAPLVAAGETSVGQLIGLLSLCDGFVGNDSGAMHVAGALGLPTVGIFGSTRAWRTGPRGPRTAVVQHPLECSPCMQRTCRYGHYDCLRGVSVDQVVTALERLLPAGS